MGTVTGPATVDDVKHVIDALSDEDRAELEALTGGRGLEVMADVVRQSVYTFIGRVDGHPAFMGGALPGGVAWMLGTPEIARAKKFYLRATRAHTEAMQALFPTLTTTVDARYVRSLRWLEWLGFELGEPQAMGLRTFHQARRSRP